MERIDPLKKKDLGHLLDIDDAVFEEFEGHLFHSFIIFYAATYLELINAEDLGTVTAQIEEKRINSLDQIYETGLKDDLVAQIVERIESEVAKIPNYHRV